MFTRQLMAELIGTFALVFAGTGAIIINDVSGGMVTHVGVSLTFGFIVTTMIYAVGDVSGAHLNPAVTFGFFLARRFPASRILPYVISQCTGALLASGLLHLLFSSHATLGATLPAGAPLQSFILECALTFFLMFVILSVSTGSKEKGIAPGIAIGAVVGLEALFAGPISGASMNPARSLAPALMSGHVEHLWIYLLAPLLGAAAAVFACRCVHESPCCGGHGKRGVTLSNTKKLLFVCIENSNRSQMAQAFARIHGKDHVEAYSAGSRPSGSINPKAIESMSEIGYDLSRHESKSIDDIPAIEYDAVISMGCGDEGCPLVRAKYREDWQIPDPKVMPPEQFRTVRDLIETKVKALLLYIK